MSHQPPQTPPAWTQTVILGGLFDPSAVSGGGGPVAACQSQEIPLLLLHSSAGATRLCVHAGGALPVSLSQSRSPLFRRWVGVGGGGGGGLQ